MLKRKFMLFFTAAIFVTVTIGCEGSVERLKHPKTVIVEAEKCAKDHGLRFTVSAVDILYQLGQIEKKIGNYEDNCKGPDDATIRRTFMCYLNACEKLTQETSSELFFTKIENSCDKEIKALSNISSSSCADWVNKLQKAISGK